MAQETHIQTMEKCTEATVAQVQATDTSIPRQGTVLLTIMRQLEDLDNRSHRCNIR
ncbi:Hypothetical predicted protein, partial [Pelobates cultripes]